MKRTFTLLTSALILSTASMVVACGTQPTKEVEEKPTEPTEPNEDKSLLVGYWYEWGGEGQVKPSLKQIDHRYNVINVSFLYTSIPYDMPQFQSNNPQELKEGIKYQQELEHKVLISFGGATGNTMKFRENQKDALKEAIMKTVNEYNFDGVDIDWEGDVLGDKTSKEVAANALKEIKHEQKKLGKNFIISMAPEFPNLRLNSHHSYEIFLEILREEYDFIYPQFYNGWADGVYVDIADANTVGVPAQSVISNDDNNKRGEFYYLLIKYITQGSVLNRFSQINANRLVLGASTSEPAGRGAATEKAILDAKKLLDNDGIHIRGLMTWAINFDYPLNWIFANWWSMTWGK